MDTQKRIEGNALGYALPWALNFVNTPQTATKMIGNALGTIATDAYKGIVNHMTGGIPLDGSRDALGAAQSLDALAPAGIAVGAAPARAAALGAKASPAAGFKAYHGSPHDFDKFSMSQIGTGEGAQAYGHGLYFAEEPAVAQAYKEALTPDASNYSLWKTVDGRQFDVARHPEDFAAVRLKSNNGDRQRAIEITESELAGIPKDWSNRRHRKNVERSLNHLKNKSESVRDESAIPGHLYEVNIKANKDEFIDLDQPLANQGEGFKNYIAQDPIKLTDQQMQTLKPGDIAGFGKRDMQLFREAGIPGIKYKDQGSRGSEGGTYNYVIFDDNLIEIAKKNGIPVKQTERGIEISERGMQMLGALQAGEQLPDQWAEMNDPMKEAILAARGL